MAQASHVTIVDGPTVPSLRRWGLSADADLVFRALILAGGGRCGDLARDLGLSRHRTRSAVDELSAARAVYPEQRAGARPNDPVWRPLPPDRVLAKLRQRRTPEPDAWEQVRRHVAVVTGLKLPENDPDRLR